MRRKSQQNRQQLVPVVMGEALGVTPTAGVAGVQPSRRANAGNRANNTRGGGKIAVRRDSGARDQAGGECS